MTVVFGTNTTVINHASWNLYFVRVSFTPLLFKRVISCRQEAGSLYGCLPIREIPISYVLQAAGNRGLELEEGDSEGDTGNGPAENTIAFLC